MPSLSGLRTLLLVLGLLILAVGLWLILYAQRNARQTELAAYRVSQEIARSIADQISEDRQLLRSTPLDHWSQTLPPKRFIISNAGPEDCEETNGRISRRIRIGLPRRPSSYAFRFSAYCDS